MHLVEAVGAKDELGRVLAALDKASRASRASLRVSSISGLTQVSVV
jgi:hypothetical protein